MIGGLISQTQNAFLQGRLINGVTLLAHELVKDYNNPMDSRMCLKVDLQKAFDTINRELLYFILHCMGFSNRWINSIKECLTSASFSIMLNGSPLGNFKSNRGVRQGCPLSPYLFVLGLEFWSISMDIALVSGSKKPQREMIR